MNNIAVWIKNQFIYTYKILRVIAENYDSLYDGLSLRDGSRITHPLSLAEYKADFDRALSSLGKRKWLGDGIIANFSKYRQFGRLQRIIIADILGVDNPELTKLGFWDIMRLRGLAYNKMLEFLNGG